MVRALLLLVEFPRSTEELREIEELFQSNERRRRRFADQHLRLERTHLVIAHTSSLFERALNSQYRVN